MKGVFLCLATVVLVASVQLCLASSHVSPPTHSHHASAPLKAADPPVFPTWPFVIHTWPWQQAADAAYAQLLNPTSDTPALDAIVNGCSRCEQDQCGGSVGFGGSPDENGETTLDAMIIDGVSLEIGAVGALRNVSNAIGVARAVMERTKHTMLVGDQATAFAVSMGFPLTNLTTAGSEQMFQQWQENDCQPNMRRNVQPDPTKYCGPYSPATFSAKKSSSRHQSVADRSSVQVNEQNHDTIAMVVIDVHGNMAAGTSTNGYNHKVPGRVGDGPIPGAGAWVDSDWGGCGATGDGDIMMRFAPCYQAIQNLRAGHTPRQAAEDALGRIERFFDFSGALVVIDREGNYGAASWGFPNFSYSVRTGTMNSTQVINVAPGDWKYVKPMGDKRKNQKKHH